MSQNVHAMVLLVEDEAIVRMNTADILSDLGYAVIEAANADQALEILAKRADIAIVFTDINMPGSMDGLKLAKAVHDRWPPVKLIITSGFVDPAELDIRAVAGSFPNPTPRNNSEWSCKNWRPDLDQYYSSGGVLPPISSPWQRSIPAQNICNTLAKSDKIGAVRRVQAFRAGAGPLRPSSKPPAHSHRNSRLHRCGDNRPQ